MWEHVVKCDHNVFTCDSHEEDVWFFHKCNLELACQYAEEHGAAAQKRYADRHNLRAREKEFVVGDLVIYLSPSSTNNAFARW